MLIFNCTEAASKFFSRIHQGKKITPVDFAPPSSTIEDDEMDTAVEQWLVHAITVQRKHVLFAMHIKTRYCMVFADMKKADLDAFVGQFADRWFNGVMLHATHHGLSEWIDIEPLIERFQRMCRPQQFYRRSHRSAQKHIDEIAWVFQDKAAGAGCLPPDEVASMVFDAQMNDTPRNSKGAKDYYFPDEEMTVHWLRRYCALDEAEVQAAKERRKQVYRQIAAVERAAWLEEYNRRNSIT